MDRFQSWSTATTTAVAATTPAAAAAAAAPPPHLQPFLYLIFIKKQLVLAI
jgi:hypothetical protein